MLFSEPKIPQYEARSMTLSRYRVSVLFSEPKIPQSTTPSADARYIVSVSVLFSEPKIPQSCPDRAGTGLVEVSVLFSEPKIPQCSRVERKGRTIWCFSALQRAENSSITRDKLPELVSRLGFQCSSASRKFLNLEQLRLTADRSIVSVLFSEPKIPQ